MTTTHSLVVLLLLLLAIRSVRATSSLRAVDEHERKLAVMEYQAVMSAPLQCFLEVGFDYVGNDIANVPAAAASDCCWLCYINGKCKAYSWTAANGGTCYLKSARGQIIVNPAVTSSLLLIGTQYKVCELMENVDFPGNDIGHVPSANAEGCCDLCHHYAGCRAYTWTSYQGGTCWLKSKSTTPVSKAGGRSAEAYSVDPGNCPYFQRDVDFQGYDIGNKPSPFYTGCCQLCENFKGCRAWSWSSYNGGTCWLKSLMGNYLGNAIGVISGLRYPNPNRPCAMESDVDYIDHDIGNTKANYPELCTDVCAEYAGCKAYTWSDYQGGTCWLKSAKGATKTTAGVKSCVL